MRFTVEGSRAWDSKCVTLLGMSGGGETYLSALLRRDWIFIRNNLRVDDLGRKELNRRQALCRQSEIAAMVDVPTKFLQKAQQIYGYSNLINESNQSAQFCVHPYTLNALIITGENLGHPGLADKLFLEPLIEVVD